MEYKEVQEKAIAIYEFTKTGKRYALMPTVYGGFHVYAMDYDDIFPRGATQSLTDFDVKLLHEYTKDGYIKWIKTPGNTYHCWHICTCDKCSPYVAHTFRHRGEGKIFTHSQDDWDSHLKFAPAENVFTFPSAT